ncbi:hypothetical protein BTI247_08420 [Bacillus thuringiensis Bt18247]|uniref:Uncharacterized protein n=1 Tax=Bacillus thuringiensis Bt18247 TaxID=1423143 RepID=A0A9W3X734_BACTU|nr:hypothetical protein BTI247_08420 [Bacillus thuringiensis Bt18247]
MIYLISVLLIYITWLHYRITKMTERLNTHVRMFSDVWGEIYKTK